MIFGVDLLQIVDGHAGVDLRGFKRLVAEHLLQMPDGGAVFEHVRCARVPERVRCDILFDARKMSAALDDLPDAVGVHFAAPAV